MAIQPSSPVLKSKTAAGSPGRNPQPSNKDNQDRNVGLKVTHKERLSSFGDHWGNVARIPEKTARSLSAPPDTMTASRAIGSGTSRKAQRSPSTNGILSGTM